MVYLRTFHSCEYIIGVLHLNFTTHVRAAGTRYLTLPSPFVVTITKMAHSVTSTDGGISLPTHRLPLVHTHGVTDQEVVGQYWRTVSRHGAACRVFLLIRLWFRLSGHFASGLARDSPSWSPCPTELLFEHTFKLRAEAHAEHDVAIQTSPLGRDMKRGSRFKRLARPVGICGLDRAPRLCSHRRSSWLSAPWSGEPQAAGTRPG